MVQGSYYFVVKQNPFDQIHHFALPNRESWVEIYARQMPSFVGPGVPKFDPDSGPDHVR
jgi:hypothetical protein